MPAPLSPQRILIIRPSALGDVCRSVPALATLRAAYPQAQIDWLVRDDLVDAIRHHPALSNAIPFPRKALSGFLLSPTRFVAAGRWASQLRKQKYDLVFDLQGLARSGLFAFLTRAPRRVGYADARELGWLGCNVRHRLASGLHTVDRTLGLLEREGYTIQRDMRLYVGAEEQAWLARFRAEKKLANQPYIVLAPTATMLCKCWPLEGYIELAKRLTTAYPDMRVVILAAPSERAYIAPLIDALGPQSPLCPPTTIAQMMALISQARLVISNDSAPVHIAVGFDRPLAALYGFTDPAREGPYRRPESALAAPGVDRSRLIKHRRFPNDQSVISRISVDQVWAKVGERLARPEGACPGAPG